METATVQNTYDLIKANPELDNADMTCLLIKNFYFAEGSNWHGVFDVVQTTRTYIAGDV